MKLLSLLRRKLAESRKAAGARAIASHNGARDKIYIELLDEGTPTWRPTEAVALSEGRFRLLATPNYDPEDEVWMFLPGSVVRCRLEKRSLGEMLVAYELAADEGKSGPHGDEEPDQLSREVLHAELERSRLALSTAPSAEMAKQWHQRIHWLESAIAQRD